MAVRRCNTSTWVAQYAAEEMSRKNRGKNLHLNKVSARNLEFGTD